MVRRLAREPFLLLAQEGLIVAGPGGQRAAIELDDPGRQPLQERAIVRDEDDRTGVLGEKGFEPLDRRDVEVIRRLVQQEHIRLRDQRAREQDTAAPPTRQGVDDGVRRQAEMRQDEFDPLLYAPAVPLFELVLQNAQAVEERLGPVLRDLERDVVVGTDQRAEVTEPIRHHVEHGAGVGKRHILLEARHANTRLQPDGSPDIARSSVLLPVPFRPMMAMRSFCSTRRDTPSSNGTCP